MMEEPNARSPREDLHCFPSPLRIHERMDQGKRTPQQGHSSFLLVALASYVASHQNIWSSMLNIPHGINLFRVPDVPYPYLCFGLLRPLLPSRQLRRSSLYHEDTSIRSIECCYWRLQSRYSVIEGQSTAEWDMVITTMRNPVAIKEVKTCRICAPRNGYLGLYCVGESIT